jgi:hypothetical protein
MHAPRNRPKRGQPGDASQLVYLLAQREGTIR